MRNTHSKSARRAGVRVAAARAALAAAVWSCATGLPAAVRAEGDAGRGRTVFALAGGCGCHTSVDGPVGAGGGEVPTPFGTFYGSNITPDRDTGIGAWSDAEIDTALRRGRARGKGAESPAMPYYRYAGMTDADAADLIAYLRSLPPVSRASPPHRGELPFARWAYAAWKRLLAPTPRAAAATAAERPDSPLARGRYLADHVSLCADCHTPRNFFGVPDGSRYLAGAVNGIGKESVPNITPHATGIGGWDAGDVYAVLRQGMLPDFDSVQGSMAEAVDGRGGGPGYKDAPEADLRAVAAYVLSVPPIDNRVGDK